MLIPSLAVEKEAYHREQTKKTSRFTHGEHAGMTVDDLVNQSLGSFGSEDVGLGSGTLMFAQV